tara:strand:- start:406 stop:1266 length:861 start_codon:yes stop_codon:yes gene_type:complete
VSFLESIKNYFVTHKVKIIDTNDEFRSSVQILSDQDYIGCDTEFVWRDTYYPILSLVQISTSGETFIIDAIKVRDIKELNQVFKNKKIIKIFHSIRGDIAALKTIKDFKIENIFDTQIAYNFLNKDSSNQISYKNLTKKYLGIELDKTETNSNWEKRPLNENQIKYAAEDSRYLIKIMKHQIKKIKSNDKEILRNLFNSELITACEDFKESRLKRLEKNKKTSLLVKKIFLWREFFAEQNNIPPNKIFHEKHLFLIEKLLIEEKFEELNWIIAEDNFRKNFLIEFK